MKLTDQPQDARVLFLDMNCFFARVEQQVQPIYRGRPVGVTPYTGGTGCVIAASYEAKELGVKTGMMVKDAKRQCPQIAILPARPALYHFYHKELIKVLETFSPFLKVLSIDEFAIRLTGRDQRDEAAKKIAFDIKDAIREKVGDWLTCSMGIASNQFLAKLAGELKKPDGLFEIKLTDLTQIYQVLKLTDLCGINHRMAGRCHAYGIYTPWALYQKSLNDMSRLFGVWGKVWYFRLRGFEVDDVAFTTKSVGHSHVLAPEFRSESGVRQVLLKLAQKTGYRLRQGQYWASGLYVGVGFFDAPHWYRVKRWPPFQDDRALTDFALSMLKGCPFDGRPLIVALSAVNLIRSYIPSISLFPELHKQQALSRAMDAINDKYGASSIRTAALLGADHAAPDRIPFGRPRFEIRNE